MVRAAIRLLLALWLASLAYTAALADRRLALVIGNSAYTHAPALDNPKNDAEDMAAALKALGFTVIVGINLDKTAMDRTILEFANALSGADAGVFHYSGHGLQVAGVNYLVPVDAKLDTAAALDFEAVRLDLVQRNMERETKTNILFLDACRNNPLARNLDRALGTRSADIGRGLARMEAGVGTLIGFSTQPGNVALDGKGRNSPYSGPLIKAISAPGKDILAILTDVRREVLAATYEKQVPWEHTALTAPFYFNRAAPSGEIPTPQAPLSDAAQAWDRIRDSKSIPVFEAFRKQYGANAVYGTLAAERIEELKRGQVAIQVPLSAQLQAPPGDGADGCGGMIAGSWDVSTQVVFPATLVMPERGFPKWRFKSDGPLGGVVFLDEKGSDRRRYSCQGKSYTLDNYFGITLTLSLDGRRLDGRCSDAWSSLGGGCRIHAVRKSGPSP
jgi:uncharacterized caspase-like protein